MRCLLKAAAGVLIVVLLLLISMPIAAETELLPDLSLLEDAVSELDATLNGTFSLSAFFDSVKNGDFSFDLLSLLGMLSELFFGEAKTSFGLLGQLMLLGIIAAILRVFEDSLQGEAAGVGQWVVYLAFLLLAVKCFHLGMELGTETIATAANFLYALLPVILSSFALVGGTAAATMVQPSVLGVITLFMGLLERFFLPLLTVMAALTVCSHLSRRFSFKNFIELIRSVILISLGFLMMLCTGVLSLSGIAAGTIDGLGAKSLKMAAGNFIPVVGGYISDAFDSILGAGLLLRSSIGIFGVIVVAVILIVPVLRILIMALLFKLVAAVLQPFGDDAFVGALSDFSSVLMLLFGLVTITGLLFFFLILCVVAVSTMTMMFR